MLDCTYAKGSLSLAGAGLRVSSDGRVVCHAITAITALKARQPNTRVMLAVPRGGGATYTKCEGLSTQCIKDIVPATGAVQGCAMWPADRAHRGCAVPAAHA